VLALLWNAVAFSERGGITLRSSWDVLSSVWTIEVCDEGSGIAPENVSHIFELFWRQGEQPPNSTSGYGVGLAMARALTRLMNGQLTLEKTGPQGSEFCLSLPLPSELAETLVTAQPAFDPTPRPCVKPIR
jgi:signal transduction histidine kinase